VSVIALEYSGKPQISDGLVAKNMDGGYSLLPWNITGSKDPLKIINKQRGGTVPSHIVINEQTKLKWNIYVDEPCSKTIDVSYSYQGATERNTIVLRAAGKEISHKVSATGKTVGEPNSDWIIDNFKSHRLGTINFSKTGYYEIELEIKPEKNENIKFQWVWVN
jgi:alpha-L-fucosidase